MFTNLVRFLSSNSLPTRLDMVLVPPTDSKVDGSSFSPYLFRKDMPRPERIIPALDHHLSQLSQLIEDVETEIAAIEVSLDVRKK